MLSVMLIGGDVVFTGRLCAQRGYALDCGIRAGAAYYTGDYNLRRQFYRPSFTLSGLAKMSLDEHHVLRAEVTYADLQIREHQSVRLAHVHAGYEFNFFPFDPVQPKPVYTPYLFAGVGYTLMSHPAAAADRGNDVTLPFGVGVKCRVSKTWTVGMEWTFVKTMTDMLDGNAGASYHALHNNDWYSFAGISVLFRMLDPKRNCSSYL